MANVSRLKRGTLGAPPPMEEASPNLHAPEIAPVAVAAATAAPTELEPQPARVDARSARRTNRTLQFATRVRPEW